MIEKLNKTTTLYNTLRSVFKHYLDYSYTPSGAVIEEKIYPNEFWIDKGAGDILWQNPNTNSMISFLEKCKQFENMFDLKSNSYYRIFTAEEEIYLQKNSYLLIKKERTYYFYGTDISYFFLNCELEKMGTAIKIENAGYYFSGGNYTYGNINSPMFLTVFSIPNEAEEAMFFFMLKNRIKSLKDMQILAEGRSAELYMYEGVINALGYVGASNE